jgi:hypothetical protein
MIPRLRSPWQTGVQVEARAICNRHETELERDPAIDDDGANTAVSTRASISARPRNDWEPVVSHGFTPEVPREPLDRHDKRF